MTDQSLQADQVEDHRAALVLKLIAAAAGAIVGALIGALFLPILLPLLGRLFPLGPIQVHPRLYCALGAASLGAITGYRRASRLVRREKRTRQVAQHLGLGYSGSADKQLAEKLGGMVGAVGGFTTLRNVLNKKTESATFLVGDLEYHQPDAEGSRPMTQTVAYFESDGLHLTEFKLQPQRVLLKLFSGITGIQPIDFDDQPEFSRTYALSAVHAKRARGLFNHRLLEYFGRNPGWHVRAQEKCLVLFRPGTSQGLEEFTQQALQVVVLFQEASRYSEPRGD